ncbi:HNH endonuclease [Pectobacterium polaris]|uniref:HNH endonuclease n=1 Tax=Pectobacterium polaris TaxID=2042057 RepID=UPI00202D5A60|nr:HNH endonuclease [Pectobacterium polaris]MCL6324025.1 HNH endonuclease [Pectobacterium polaris]
MTTVDECIDHGRVGNADGYLATNRKIDGVLRSCYLHRLVYCQSQGLTLEDINGLVVRHKCDNPRCVNPNHLEIGTVRDNNIDCVLRGRHPKPNARIDLETAENIRSEYKTREVTQKQIGEKYGLSRTHIGGIVRHEAWKANEIT